MKIDFTAVDFTPGLVQTGEIDVLWPDLVWAAITYGKNSSFPWNSSAGYARAEKKYRAYLLYTCLKEARGIPVQSEGYLNMDATEKGAASYFLGMTLAKLVAERLLNTPWLWHVSCATQALSFLKGKSRPDMLGCNLLGRWIVVEAKGRSGNFDLDALNSAKNQTGMVSTVNGTVPYCRVGTQSYFDPEMKVYLKDPPPLFNAEPIQFDLNRALDEYYGFRHLLTREGKSVRVLDIEYLVAEEVELGIKIGLPKTLVDDYGYTKLTKILSGLPPRYSFENEGDIKEPPEFTENVNSILRLPNGNGIVQNLPTNSGIYADGYFIELDERWSNENMVIEPFERE